MKSKAVLTLAASAVAMTLAACGGGGGGGDGTPTPTPTPANASLQVSGTAATGAALASANVEVKCAAGSATATTSADGKYSVTITDGALPCMVEVKKTAAGTTVTLHSLVESGAVNTAERRTTALANVTPITGMIVAQLGAALPEDSFRAFNGGALTSVQVQAAVAAIVAALKNAGLDLGTIDPLKADLVAATSSGQGNTYDQLLDALAAKVDDDALKFLMNQIVSAAQARSDDGLKSAMQTVASGGKLAGCPVAVSGMYRSVDLFGTVLTHSVDFKTMRIATPGTTDSLAITADPTESCVFTASGTLRGVASTVRVVIGPNGIGNFRADNAGNIVDTIGFLFPAQWHSYSALRGTWSVLGTEVTTREHSAGQVTFGEERKVTSCSYDSSWTCVADPVTLTAAERTDGSVSIAASGTEPIVVYGYRAPNGALALFGGVAQAGDVATRRVSIVAAKLAALPVPAVGTVTKSWDAGFDINGSNVLFSTNPVPMSYTITAADATAGTATRRNDASGRIETLRYNKPVTGVRTRNAGTFNGGSFAELVQIPLPGMGVTLSVNAVPWGPDSMFVHHIAVVK